MHNQLVTKVNNIEENISATTGLINKSQYDTDTQNLEKRCKDLIKKKQPNVTGLVKKTD